MSTPHAGDAVLDALAAYRLTRLATKDVILNAPRAAIVRAAYRHSGRRPAVLTLDDVELLAVAEEDQHAPKLAELVICRWCTGLWISFGVVAARRYAGPVWDPFARALALSAAAALVAGLETG